MNTPVTLVTIHHQGGGAPHDDVPSDYPYTYWIGSTIWTRIRDVWSSWGTLNFNGTSLDICFSGSRGNTDPAYPVTDHDIELVRSACADARKLGYVTDFPQVRAHRNSPGSSTVCPGDLAMSRWSDIEAACMADAPPQPKPPEDDVTDLASAINHDGRPVVVQVGGDRRLYFKIRAPEGGDWGSWRDLSGGLSGFSTVTAFVNPNSKRIEVWVTMVDGKSYNRWQTGDDFAGWSDWVDQTR